MKFKTTLYNSQVDLLNFPGQRPESDMNIECEITWSMYIDRKPNGISVSWLANEAQLKIVTTENDKEIATINEHIHPDNDWTIEFEESGLLRSEFFHPREIIVDFKDKKAFCTLIREGDDLPF